MLGSGVRAFGGSVLVLRLLSLLCAADVAAAVGGEQDRVGVGDC